MGVACQSARRSTSSRALNVGRLEFPGAGVDGVLGAVARAHGIGGSGEDGGAVGRCLVLGRVRNVAVVREGGGRGARRARRSAGEVEVVVVFLDECEGRHGDALDVVGLLRFRFLVPFLLGGGRRSLAVVVEFELADPVRVRLASLAARRVDLREDVREEPEGRVGGDGETKEAPNE